MDAVDKRLVRRTQADPTLRPAVRQGRLEPGYIKGYVPGIRENGGQYTHAATWVVLATALQGHGTARWNALEPDQSGPPDRDACSGAHVIRSSPTSCVRRRLRVPPHTGAARWTWYTGSAGWLYRVALESILGFLPAKAARFASIRAFREAGRIRDHLPHRSTMYRVQVDNSAGTGRGVMLVALDGQQLLRGLGAPSDDQKHHEIRVELG